MRRRIWAGVGVIGIAALSATAAAVTTQSFVLDDAASLGAGELEGTSVQSIGTVTLGVSTKRFELENVPVASSLARARDGSVFVGTGTDGKVYRLKGDKIRPYAETGQLMVSALTFGWNRTLYAATLPEGRIFAITGENKARELVRLPDTEHVWALVYDESRRKLVAGTGAEGKVFTIDKKGKASVLYDATAAHVMSLAVGAKGDLYAGTSDDALVLRISGKGRSEVLHDFPGNEITAIAFRGNVLAVAANEFASPPAAVSRAKPSLPSVGGRVAPPPPPPKRPRLGKGRLWRIDADRRVERLLKRDDGHFTVVEWDDTGAILVGAGNEGRIFRVFADGQHATWVDVEERQVLALDLQGAAPVFATGDSAAIYRVKAGTPKKAIWTSKVLDAKFVSRWGRMAWRGSGKFEFETRSGNTKEPNEGWSPWAKVAGKAKSPSARFIQVRARFPRNSKAVLRAVELFYLPQNQRGRVSNVRLKKTPAKPLPGKPARQPARSTRYPLTWDVDNPDGDELRFRLRFREESQTIWRDVFRDDVVLTKNQYTWETDSVPDGHYVVRVEASDERANPKSLALAATADSEPLLIDNHPPTIRQLSQKRNRVEGRAVDGLGPISRIEIAVDGGAWHDVFPVDGLLDSADERFFMELTELGAGAHIVATRVTDAARNQATAEITIKTKR